MCSSVPDPYVMMKGSLSTHIYPGAVKSVGVYPIPANILIRLAAR